jgi:aspartate/tyrosine/aromatic aminotransferase
MFESLTPAPPDAILGLTVAFNDDPNPNKINLGVGVFKDADGNTPILKSVRTAEERLLLTERTKSYLPIDGGAAYNSATQKLLFGDNHPVLRSGLAVTSQTPGGTGALRVAADFIAKTNPDATVWVSDPTWPNHPGVFGGAGLQVKSYPYFDAANDALDFQGMAAAVARMKAGDVLVLHGCCHNPTGVDLGPQQWDIITQLVSDLRILPLIDFAYQGFATGLRQDAEGWLRLAQPGRELIVASSYSKNFGLYNERVGAMTLVGATRQEAEAALSHVKTVVRTNYSNPPSHGGSIVSTVLNDEDLREQWEQEVADMRNRINNMRGLFVETLNEKGVDRDFSFIARQRGMFSFSGLNPSQVKRLRDEYSIYIVGSGRINVAGMRESNMDYLCEAIANVL